MAFTGRSSDQPRGCAAASRRRASAPRAMATADAGADLLARRRAEAPVVLVVVAADGQVRRSERQRDEEEAPTHGAAGRPASCPAPRAGTAPPTGMKSRPAQVGVVRRRRLELSALHVVARPRNWFAPQTIARCASHRQPVCADRPAVGPAARLPSGNRHGRADAARGVPRRRVLRPDPHRGHAVARLRARPRRPDPAVQRGVRARDGLPPRGAARSRRARLRDPARGARGVRRVPRVRLEDGHAEPAGRPLADQGRRPAAHRVVEQADGRPGRRRPSRSSRPAST